MSTIQLRVDLINGQFELDQKTKDFMVEVRINIATVANELVNLSPGTCDVDRFIAALDHLQQAKNLFCDSAILGLEAKRRKEQEEHECPY
jgi:hypothetical protein